MSLSQDEASRLAFIRYLHQQSVQQGRLPEPQSSTAVLLLHDAIEAFLLLAAEHLGAAAPREFAGYWEALSPSKLTGGVDLAVKQGMVRLNKVRVNLKHHGSTPAGWLSGRAAVSRPNVIVTAPSRRIPASAARRRPWRPSAASERSRASAPQHPDGGDHPRGPAAPVLRRCASVTTRS